MNEKLTECPKCGAEDYDCYHVRPGEGDPSKTYCVCTNCKTEFDGMTPDDSTN